MQFYPVSSLSEQQQSSNPSLSHQETIKKSVLDTFARATKTVDQEKKTKLQLVVIETFQSQLRPHLLSQENFRKLICELIEKVENDQSSLVFARIIEFSNQCFQSINTGECPESVSSVQYDGNEHLTFQRLLESETEDKYQMLSRIIHGMESHYLHKLDLKDQFRSNITHILKSANHPDYHDHFVRVIKVASRVFNSYPVSLTNPLNQDKGKGDQPELHVSAPSASSWFTEILSQLSNCSEGLLQSESPPQDFNPNQAVASTSTPVRLIGEKSKLRPEDDEREQSPPRKKVRFDLNSTSSSISQDAPQPSRGSEKEVRLPLSPLNVSQIPVATRLETNRDLADPELAIENGHKTDDVNLFRKCLKVCDKLYNSLCSLSDNDQQLQLVIPYGLEKFCRYRKELKELDLQSNDLKFFERKPKNPIFEYCLFLDLQKPQVISLGKKQLFDELKDPSLKEISGKVRHWFDSRRTFN